jgi:hypothetical protein
MSKRKTAYQRIMLAANHDAGVRLTADEAFDLSLDGAIAARAALDDAYERCAKRGHHKPDASGLCVECESDTTEAFV